MDANVAPVITSIASLIAALASLGAVALGVLTRSHVKAVEKATNGMKTELVAEVRAAAFLKGEKQGVANEKNEVAGKDSPKIDPPAGAVSG